MAALLFVVGETLENSFIELAARGAFGGIRILERNFKLAPSFLWVHK